MIILKPLFFFQVPLLLVLGFVDSSVSLEAQQCNGSQQGGSVCAVETSNRLDRLSVESTVQQSFPPGGLDTRAISTNDVLTDRNVTSLMERNVVMTTPLDKTKSQLAASSSLERMKPQDTINEAVGLWNSDGIAYKLVNPGGQVCTLNNFKGNAAGCE